MEQSLFSCLDPFKWDYDYVLVNKCPLTWTNSYIKKRCELDEDPTLSSLWPVDDQSSLSFRNIFCAVCNEIQISKLSLFRVTMKRKEDSGSVQFFADNTLRFCNPSTRGNCPNFYENATVREACGAFQAPVRCAEWILAVHEIDINIEYKNPFCQLCDNESITLECEHHPTELKFPRFESTLIRIWNFQTKTGQVAKSEQDPILNCLKNEFYDALRETCYALSCARGFTLQGKECRPENEIQWVITHQNFDETFSEILFEHNNTNIDCFLRVLMGGTRNESEVLNATFLNYLGLTVKSTPIGSLGNNGVKKFGISIIISRKESVKLSETLEREMLSVQNESNILQCYETNMPIEFIRIDENNHSERICSETWYEVAPSQVTLVNNTQLGTVYHLNDEFIIPDFVMYHAKYSYRSASAKATKRDLLVFCGTQVPYLKCPLLTLKTDEFNVSESGDYSLTYNGRSYSSDSFVLLANGQAQICDEKTNLRFFNISDHLLKLSPDIAGSNRKWKPFSGPLDIVNTVGIVLSSISLLLTFLIHCTISDIRNAHGRGVMSLCVSLFFAHIISLISDKVDVPRQACISLAVLSHYFWLSSFTWMSIIAGNLMNTLVFKALQKTEDNTLNLVGHPLIGWVMPLAIVSTCLAFHFFTNLLTYGSGDFCWISNGIANLFAFGLPIGVHLCVNVVFFTKTAYSLLKAGQTSRKLQNSSNANRWEELVVCLKISSVMGFTWALGFIEGATDVEAYSWIFVIINSMQGIFIFMAFGFNHRIRSLLRAKLSKLDTK
ncbi:uncharacterized protein [Amphiura filiformis]|uniref:uncharacterized protein n=1 Tax=Amphiura filiformis TaxID=82378 RepID=UPI003B2136F8